MPELPEVETIVRGLRGAIVGRRIRRIEIALAKMAVAPEGVDFARAVTGERIAGVSRRGKYAVITLESGQALVISLRMTGRLVVGASTDSPFPYTYVSLDLTGGRRLSFADVRKFGRMRLVRKGEPWDAALGPEPFSTGFTPEAFIGMLSGRTTPVKVFLLDQRRIAGIGNIYACEALWEARIDPRRPAKALSKPAIRRLHGAVMDVLHRAITMRGSSIDDYVDARGRKGGFQNALSVYGKADHLCPRCRRTIKRTVLGQRGTWWCPGCQR